MSNRSYWERNIRWQERPPPNWIYSISSILYLPVIPYLSCSLSLCFRFRSYDKTRLLALYFISKPDLDSAKKKKLIDAADLPAEEAECIQNLDLPALKEIAVRRTTCSQSLFPWEMSHSIESSMPYFRYLIVSWLVYQSQSPDSIGPSKIYERGRDFLWAFTLRTPSQDSNWGKLFNSISYDLSIFLYISTCFLYFWCHCW